MLRFYAAEEIHAALVYPRLAEALTQAFAAGAQGPVRQAHSLGGSDTLLLMPAWNDAALGVKLAVMPGNGARGVGTVQAIYVLLDRATGEPLALLDGEALTLRRTAATSALAARYLAREDAQNLLVVGAGRLAPYLASAHCALRVRTAPEQRERRVDRRQSVVARRIVRHLDEFPRPSFRSWIRAR